MPLVHYARRSLPFLAVAVFLTLVYDGWVFYSRWDRTREAEKARAEKEAADAQHTIEELGGSELKITGFYAVPGTIQRGKDARLCYGVVNAKTVRIEPAVKDLYPALSFCWDVSPRRTTGYRLFADDGAGHNASAQTVVQVRP